MDTSAAPPPSGGGCGPALAMLACTSTLSTTWLRWLFLSTICSYRLLIQLFSLSQNVSDGPSLGNICEHDSGMLLSLTAFHANAKLILLSPIVQHSPRLKQGGQFDCPRIKNADDFANQRAVILLRW